ncbi:MAG: hypothetical protein Q7J16_03545 [Candidatus Cloacimonadales bacterium]|nr:hypothetical protein [Candidatus Cloacimonadales bacterium]
MKKIVIVVLGLIAANFLFAGDYQVGDHDLLLLPTAYTMPRGSGYFSDYELFFINYSFAPTDRTIIGAFSLFPIVTDFLDTFSISVKQNYLKFKNLQSAAWIAYAPKMKGLSIGNVISIATPNSSFHIGYSALNDTESDNWENLFMLGIRAELTERTDFIIEFENTSTLIEENFSGIVSLGIRFKSERVAWDFAGVRPLAEDTGSLLFIPLIKATVYFP